VWGAETPGKSLVRDGPKHSDNKIQNKSGHQSYLTGLVGYLEVYPYYVYHKVIGCFHIHGEYVLSVP